MLLRVCLRCAFRGVGKEAIGDTMEISLGVTVVAGGMQVQVATRTVAMWIDIES